MGVFKNEVGRPSNKVIKTRRIMVGSFVALFIGLFTIGINYINNINNSKKLKGSVLQKVQWDTSGVYFDHNEITKTDNSVTIKEVYYMYGDVYNSKSKKAGYDRIINDDDVNYLERNLKKISSSGDSLVKKLADVNHDGKIDTTDVNLLKRMSSSQKTIYGDLDGDKQITYKDKKILYKYLNGKKVLKISQRKLADIDGNKKVNKTDYELMLYKPAYVYCLTLESDISKAKKSCTWYQAGDISTSSSNVNIYRKDLSNDEIRIKSRNYLIKRELIEDFSSHDFGKQGNFTGTGLYHLESYDGKKFVFSIGERCFHCKLVDTVTRKTIFDPTKDKTFELKAGKTYYLKLTGIEDNKTLNSKTVPIRLVSDGTYMKNAVIGKKAEVLTIINNNDGYYSNSSLTLLKNTKYHYLAFLDARVDQIIIPKGFDFSNLEYYALGNGIPEHRREKPIKIVNKTGKKADWPYFFGLDTDKNGRPLECEFVTGVCEYFAGSSVNTSETNKLIVTDK